MATKKKQTDDQIFAEVNKHWNKLMNCLIRAYHDHDMSIEITCKDTVIKGYYMGIPEKEYTKKDLEEGRSDGMENLSLKLEKEYYTD